MKRFFFLLYLLSGLGFSKLWAQSESLRLHIPSAEEEADYVWRTLQDISFFEEHQYSVSLPGGELMEQLKQKARKNLLADTDYVALQAYMRDSIYSRADYAEGYTKIEARIPLLEKLIASFISVEKDWNFYVPPFYEIKLTLYGPGGSYDPEVGSILIFTTPKGQFKQYEDPANTLIHEMIHIGTEASIMQQYALPHPLKERIIDLIVQISFGAELPAYRLQSFGDSRIDPYLQRKADIQQLDEIMKRFQQAQNE